MKRIISLTLISALIFSLCSCSTAGAEATSTETASAEAAMTEPSEVESTESSESSAETEQYDDIESFFIVETEPHNNVLINNDLSTVEYDSIINQVTYDKCNVILLGFDNEYSINCLRNNLYNDSGQADSTSTLSDVNYFQGTQFMAEMTSQVKFSDEFSMNDTSLSPTALSYVRAILQLNGWRFGIDEIPFDYINQRFPLFVQSMYENGELPSLMQGEDSVAIEYLTDPLSYTNMYDYDYAVFTSIMMYNYARSCYIYNNPYGNLDNLTDDVLQVRDAETGRNVLVPTEEQYYQMMEDITSIPGCENVDIRFVETRENFYESYGCYPEDLINDTMIYEGNVSN